MLLDHELYFVLMLFSWILEKKSFVKLMIQMINNMFCCIQKTHFPEVVSNCVWNQISWNYVEALNEQLIINKIKLMWLLLSITPTCQFQQMVRLLLVIHPYQNQWNHVQCDLWIQLVLAFNKQFQNLLPMFYHRSSVFFTMNLYQRLPISFVS